MLEKQHFKTRPSNPLCSFSSISSCRAAELRHCRLHDSG
jgi:hypothetical protein